MREATEAEIEKSICDYLKLKGYFFWKQHVAGFFDPIKRTMRKHHSPYVRTGVPDIILIHRGRFIGLEVKTKSGRQSDNQLLFQEDLERAGGMYFVVRSIGDLEEVLREL